MSHRAAVEQCETQPHSTATAHFSVVPSTDPDYGTVSVVVAGVTSTISYNTDQGTVALNEELVSVLDGNPYVTAAYAAGEITITTIAGGPYTLFTISASVDNQCTPVRYCGHPPSLTHSDFSGGL
ncbi:MAG: hypothetical protein ACRD1F_05240 [Terriglobales bacterium]